MKFLKCKTCDELVRLRREWQACSCKASQGRYINGREVEIVGPCELYGVRSIDYFSGGEAWKEKLFKKEYPPRTLP